MANTTKLKLYLLENRIEHLAISKWTGLSLGAISKFVNTGKGNKSTKKLISLYLQLSDKEFSRLLKSKKSKTVATADSNASK